MGSRRVISNDYIQALTAMLHGCL